MVDLNYICVNYFFFFSEFPDNFSGHNGTNFPPQNGKDVDGFNLPLIGGNIIYIRPFKLTILGNLRRHFLDFNSSAGEPEPQKAIVAKANFTFVNLKVNV